MGFGCSYHPFECSHDKFCEHCTNAKTANHEPDKCWLCCDGDPSTNKPIKFVDEPFAIEVRVRNYTGRKRRIKITGRDKGAAACSPQLRLWGAGGYDARS